MKKLFVPFLCCILFASCAHYTGQDGLKKIHVEEPSATVTNYNLIKNGPVVEVDKDALISTLQTENKNLTQENTRLASTNAEQATKLAADESDIASMSTKLATLQTRLATYTTQEAKLASDESRIASMTIELATLQANFATLQARLATYTEQEAKEKAAAQAIVKEQATLPDLDTIKYPKLYKNGGYKTSAATEKINVLLIPLGQSIYSEKEITEIAGAISDIKAQIIIATGNKANVYQLVKVLNKSALLTEMGAIISDYEPYGQPDQWGVRLKLDDKRVIRLAAAEMPQTKVFESFLSGKDWKSVVKQEKDGRLKTITDMLSGDSASEAAILGASLYEPATTDWNTMSPVGYRQSDFSWPLTDAILNAGYMDTYRQNHFSEATDAGNTIIEQTLRERTDYLFAKHILPLASNIVTLGPESVVTEGYARMGVLAGYLVP